MKNFLIVVLLAALSAGCVVAAGPGYEPDVVVGAYPLGFYNPDFGYWDGGRWDRNYYDRGHGGWGHSYRGHGRR